MLLKFNYYVIFHRDTVVTIQKPSLFKEPDRKSLIRKPLTVCGSETPPPPQDHYEN